MKYQNIINLLDNTRNQPPKIKTKNWVEINNELRGTYNKDNQIRFKTSVLRSSLCGYSDLYINVKRTITFENKAAQDQSNNATNKKNYILKSCVIY